MRDWFLFSAKLYPLWSTQLLLHPPSPVRRKPDHRKGNGEPAFVWRNSEGAERKGTAVGKNTQPAWWLWRLTLIPYCLKQMNPLLPRSNMAAADLLNTITVGDREMHIPAGSSLPLLNNGEGRLASIDYKFYGNFLKRDEQQPGIDPSSIVLHPWLDAPYLWEARTPLGVDCSGFTQVIFKQMGIDLPRDAWQQAQEENR